MYLIEENDLMQFENLIKSRKEISFSYVDLVSKLNLYNININVDYFHFWFLYQKWKGNLKNYYAINMDDLIQLSNQLISIQKVKNFNKSTFENIDNYYFQKSENKFICFKSYLPYHNEYIVNESFFDLLDFKMFNPQDIDFELLF